MPSGVVTSNFDSLLSVGTSTRRVPDSRSRLVSDFDDSGARELMFLWASTASFEANLGEGFEIPRG